MAEPEMVAVRDFTREPSTYIERVGRGGSFRLTRYGKVVARLLPPEEMVIADEQRRIEQQLRQPDPSTTLDAVGPSGGVGKVSIEQSRGEAVERQRKIDDLLHGSRKKP